jgi:hypothetical protein
MTLIQTSLETGWVCKGFGIATRSRVLPRRPENRLRRPGVTAFSIGSPAASRSMARSGLYELPVQGEAFVSALALAKPGPAACPLVWSAPRRAGTPGVQPSIRGASWKRLQTAPHHPVVPPAEVFSRGLFVDVAVSGHGCLLQRPRPRGLQAALSQLGELPALLRLHRGWMAEPVITRSRQTIISRRLSESCFPSAAPGLRHPGHGVAILVSDPKPLARCWLPDGRVLMLLWSRRRPP